MLFQDRVEAGQRLGARLREFVQQELAAQKSQQEALLVLALPRGGVPVGFEVARMLHAPLDVFVVRKLGAPGHEELAMGAIASGGVCVMNEEVVEALRITPAQMEETTARELQELERRERAYRGERAPLEVSGRTIFLVDDGLATGYTMRAAVAALRQEHPKRIVVAVPVAARSTCEELDKEADAALCLYTPFEFVAVGQWYRNFAQTSDDEVRALLHRAAGERQSISN
ncbi:MAG TPA: phosphoribosyltransferase [Acidobacteriaceae bacterium]